LPESRCPGLRTAVLHRELARSVTCETYQCSDVTERKGGIFVGDSGAWGRGAPGSRPFFGR